MSVPGSVGLGKLGSSFGGAPTVAGIVVAGIVAGGLAGFVAGRPADTGPIDGQLPVYACPGVGPELARVEHGQRMLVTGRTADGAWLRIHFPSPGRSEAWIPAAVTLETPAGELPEATCAPLTGAAIVPARPGETFSPVANNSPSPTPTPTPTPTPKPTPTPTPKPTPRPTPKPTPRDQTPPLVGIPVANPFLFWGDDEAGCNEPPDTTTTVRVTAEDDESGIKSVRLHWTEAQTQISGSGAMKLHKPTGTWRILLDADAQGAFPDGGLPAGFYTMRAVATNNAGLQTESELGEFIVSDCS